MATIPPTKTRCCATVPKKGEMRLRRGHGFYRHYTKEQCKRDAMVDGLCKQHYKMAHRNDYDGVQI